MRGTFIDSDNLNSYLYNAQYSQNDQAHIKNHAAFATRFLTCV